ncbi:universal stress protein [Candidatus Moduliflexota bacterium]
MSAAEVCPISGLTRIILATDGSEHSEKALVEAVSLAKACGTMLSAVTVVETNPEYAALAPKAIEKAEAEAKEFLDAVKECAAKEDVQVQTVVLHGQDVATVLVEHAKKADADMIVMGRHGKKKGLKKLFMGSVTSSLISHAPCKVLVVP